MKKRGKNCYCLMLAKNGIFKGNNKAQLALLGRGFTIPFFMIFGRGIDEGIFFSGKFKKLNCAKNNAPYKNQKCDPQQGATNKIVERDFSHRVISPSKKIPLFSCGGGEVIFSSWAEEKS